MSDGTAEARVAARWWTDRLTDASTTDTGDEGQDLMLNLVRGAYPDPLTGEQIEAFRAALEAGILSGPVSHESWRKAVEIGDPKWGSGMRDIGTDYGPDPILADALEAAGIRNRGPVGPLPLKTVMWINPGEVRVGHGHAGPIEDLELT